MDDRYEIVWFRGSRFDRYTVQALLAMEAKLGYTLSVMQGSYHGGVGASAGTHNGGGAVDLSSADAHDKVRAGRGVGHFAMWERPAISGLWPHHIHGILIGNERAAPIAQRQVSAYRGFRDGLASNRSDNTWHPSSITGFPYRRAPLIAVDLSNLQVDFHNALHEHASNRSTRRGKIVQAALNRKLTGVKPLLVDGQIGIATADRWGRWEEVCDVDEPNRIPDMARLRRLLRGSPWRALA